MNYSRKLNDQLNEEVNYDEYNRNNYLVNNIKFNNRYSTYDCDDTLQTNNNNTNINPNVSYNNNQNINFNSNNNSNNNLDNQINNNQNNIMNSRNFNNNINNNNLNTSMNNNNLNNNMNNSYNNINDINDNNINNTINNNINNNINNDLNNTINNNINDKLNKSQNVNYNNNMVNSQDINVDLNQYVRSGLESKGLHIGRMKSPRSIKLAEMERKKSLLNNIQTQISLTKKTKLEELKKRQEEDAQYLRDMVVCFPFGRGGGGAPNRDKSGNIITNRRALVSDPKYNFASINVDDDYNEVWGKEKRLGRYYKNSSDFQNNNNNNTIQNNENINYAETIPTTPSYNNNNFNNNDFYNQPQMNNNRPYSTNPRQINNNYSNYNQNRILRSYNNLNNNDLIYKMKEEENRKLLELKQRELEQEKENERILKEIEEIDKEQNEIRLRNSLREQNKLLQSYKNINNNNDNIEDNENGGDNTTIETNNIYRTNIIQRDIIDPDSVILDKYAIDKINKSEMESRNRLNNEISRLRDQMHNQQLLLFQQISNLRNEAEKANNQREEALKEIEKLKAQIYQKNSEDLKKRYVHHLIVTDDGNKNYDTSTQTDLPPKKDEDPLELNKLLRKNIDRLKYLEEIERLNALRRSPPTNHEYEYPKVIPEKEEEDDDLYEIEITKIHN